jgi:hypothetical protein
MTGIPKTTIGGHSIEIYLAFDLNMTPASLCSRTGDAPNSSAAYSVQSECGSIPGDPLFPCRLAICWSFRVWRGAASDEFRLFFRDLRQGRENKYCLRKSRLINLYALSYTSSFWKDKK